jgi:hypothetical protein
LNTAKGEADGFRDDAVGSVGAKPPQSTPPESAHGQKLRAMIVKTISKEFDSVRVEQNHCHGLRRFNNSYTALDGTAAGCQ